MSIQDRDIAYAAMLVIISAMLVFSRDSDVIVAPLHFILWVNLSVFVCNLHNLRQLASYYYCHSHIKFQEIRKRE